MTCSTRITIGNILHLLTVFASLYIEIHGECAQLASHCVALAHTAEEPVHVACAPFLRTNTMAQSPAN